MPAATSTAHFSLPGFLFLCNSITHPTLLNILGPNARWLRCLQKAHIILCLVFTPTSAPANTTTQVVDVAASLAIILITHCHYPLYFIFLLLQLGTSQSCIDSILPLSRTFILLFQSSLSLFNFSASHLWWLLSLAKGTSRHCTWESFSSPRTMVASIMVHLNFAWLIFDVICVWF